MNMDGVLVGLIVIVAALVVASAMFNLCSLDAAYSSSYEWAGQGFADFCFFYQYYSCGHYSLKMIIWALVSLLVVLLIVPWLFYSLEPPVIIAIFTGIYLLTCIGMTWWAISDLLFLQGNPEVTILPSDNV